MERARSPSAYVLAVPPVKLTSGDAVSVACAAERAEKFVRAPKVHTAVLLWPHWSIEAGREARVSAPIVHGRYRTSADDRLGARSPCFP